MILEKVTSKVLHFNHSNLKLLNQSLWILEKIRYMPVNITFVIFLILCIVRQVELGLGESPLLLFKISSRAIT